MLNKERAAFSQLTQGEFESFDSWIAFSDLSMG